MGLLLSFTALGARIESAFQQQLLALSPLVDHFRHEPLLSIPSGSQAWVFVVSFVLLMSYLFLFQRRKEILVFVTLLAFVLSMLQILLAVMHQLWLPTVWSNLSLFLAGLLLSGLSSFHHYKKTRPLSADQQLVAIQQQIERENFETAVLMLRRCQFSDELFDIAYELGQRLEQLENWILARYLYNWLLQFDPGIEDFVRRMDLKIMPDLDEGYTIQDITQDKDQIGHYKLVGKKAQGATATVYEAYDLKTHKRIALKILNQLIDDNTGGRDVLAFLHEAMMVSKLDHPNIVKIHDADVVNEHAYIAMDYIEGYPMSERLRRKRLLTSAESLRIMHAVLNALVAAHQQGVIHGDIKPANIMYDKRKKLYILTDFGAANNGSSLLGNEKRIVGTPAYMSPEQLSGNKMDGRSDLFSLAVTVYHLLTGTQLFAGDKLSELKKNVLHQAVDLQQLNVPGMLRQLLEKALQKKTYQRFADASQMLQAVIYCEQKLKQQQDSKQGL